MTTQQLAGGIAVLMKHARDYSIPNVDAKAITESYRMMCGTMPGDLFERGVLETLRGWKWGNRLPMPGEIWDAVKPEYERRQRDVGRLTTALKFGRYDEPVPIGERVSQASLDELMMDVRRTLSTATPKGMRT